MLSCLRCKKPFYEDEAEVAGLCVDCATKELQLLRKRSKKGRKAIEQQLQEEANEEWFDERFRNMRPLPTQEQIDSWNQRDEYLYELDQEDRP